VSLNPITLICFGCGARFRLVPKGDRLPQSGIKCPRCSERISLPSHLRNPDPDVQAQNREDEGGPDLLDLLAGEANFPGADAPLEDACGEFQGVHQTAAGPLPRRVIDGSRVYTVRPRLDDGHLYVLGLLLAVVTAVAAILNAATPRAVPSLAPVAKSVPNQRQPPVQRATSEPIAVHEDESALRLRLASGETGLGAKLAAAMAADPSFRPAFPLLRARDQFFFEAIPDAWAPTWSAGSGDRPPAEFVPGPRHASAAPMAWRICVLLGCRVDVARAKEALVPSESVSKDGAVVVTRLGAFTSGAWVEPAPDPRFPLSDRALWSPWLRRGPPGALEQPAIELLAPLDSVEGGAAARKALEPALGGRSAKSLAASLSDTLVWVWLTGSEALLTEPGARRPPFGAGPAGVSVLDLGPAFTGTEGRIERSPLRDVVRYRQSTVQVLRVLDREATRAALVPVGPLAGAHASEHFGLFWERRQRLLAHIDTLMEREGRDEVLYFD
jgi:hypothetical protein